MQIVMVVTTAKWTSWVVNLKNRTPIIFQDPQKGDYGSKVTLLKGTVYALAFPKITLAVEAIISL